MAYRNYHLTSSNPPALKTQGPPKRSMKKPILLPDLSPVLPNDDLGSPEFRDAVQAAKQLRAENKQNSDRSLSPLPRLVTFHADRVREITDNDQTKRMQTRVAIRDKNIPPHRFQVIPLREAQKVRASPQSLRSPATNFASHLRKHDPLVAPISSPLFTPNGLLPAGSKDLYQSTSRGSREDQLSDSFPLSVSVEAAIAQFETENKALCSSPSLGSSTQSATSFDNLRDLHDRHTASSNNRRKHPISRNISPDQSTESFRQVVSVDGVAAVSKRVAKCSSDRGNRRRAIYTESMYLATSISSNDIALRDEQAQENLTRPNLLPTASHEPSQGADKSECPQLNSNDGPTGPRRYRLPLASIDLNVTMPAGNSRRSSPHPMPPFSFLSQNPARSSISEVDPNVNVTHHPIIRDLLVLLELAIDEWNLRT